MAKMLCTLLLCIASFLSSAIAQQYAGSTIPNSLPSVPGSELAYWRIAYPTTKSVCQNLTVTNYQSLQQSGQRIVPSQIQRAVIVIHGLNRDPGTYMSNMLSALNAITTDSNVNQSSVVVVAPYFSNGDDKNYGYPFNAGQPAGQGSNTSAVVFQGSQWSAGGINQYPYQCKNISSFDVLDQMTTYFANKAMFPNLKQIVVGGHSLGAQTVQRYAMIGKKLSISTPITLWIGNPNSYIWPALTRPLSTAGCYTYDVYRDGYTNFTQYPMTYAADLVAQGRSAILANYNSKNVAYGRGLQDLGDDSSTCAPGTTGANRNERFFNFIKAFPPQCADPKNGPCNTIDYVNTGHDAGSMFNSPSGQARFFLDNFYGDGNRSYDGGYPRQQKGDDPYPNPGFASNNNTNTNVYAGNMTYVGCWTDNTQSGRSLSILADDSSNNTIEMCTAACSSAGYTMAGLELGTQCFCDKALSYASQQTVDQGCSTACGGNSSEVCGNNNRLSLFSTGGTITQNPVPGSPEVIGNYNAYQCMTEATNGLRALSAKSYSDTVNMTLESCASFCSGYQYFGAEYGQECYCGSYFNAGSNVASNNDCNMVCNGNIGELCGGPSRLNVYQLSNGNSPIVTQAPPSATPSSAPISSIPTASQCPTINGTTITDSNKANYTIYCSSDSSTGAYTSTSASNSYLDCMGACDTTSSTGCVGWTYVGQANGGGSGTCYLKSGTIGNIIAAGTNLITGQLVGASAPVSPSSTSAVSSTSSSPSAGPTGLCPAANGTNIGSGYTVFCSSDTTVGSYGSASAPNTYQDCATACDADSRCQGAVYVGQNNGEGSGTCYLKSPVGNVVSAGANLIAIVKNSASSSTSSSVLSTSASLSSSTQSIALTASGTSSGTSTSTSASATPTQMPPDCPRSNGTTYSSNGLAFLIECGIDHQGGDMSSLSVNSFQQCIDTCATTTGCVDVALSGSACYLKNKVGANVYNAVYGARLVPIQSTTSSSTSQSTSSATQSTDSTVSTTPSVSATSSTDSASSPSSASSQSATSSSSSSVQPSTTSQMTSTSSSQSTTFTSSITPSSSSKSTSSSTSVSSTTSTTSIDSRYTAIGCYTDNTSARAFGVSLPSSSSNTPAECASRCSAQNYRYSGTEYSFECYCDNYIRNNAALASDSTTCNTKCSGDSTQTCGGSARITILQDTQWQQTFFVRQSYSSWNLVSCYVDKVSTRTLRKAYSVPGGGNNETIANCLDACTAGSSTYCGAEYSSECYGSSSAPDDSLALAGDPLTQGCTMPCSGNSTESCGGSARVLIYINNGTAS